MAKTAQTNAASSSTSSAGAGQTSQIMYGPQTSQDPVYSEIFYGPQMPAKRPSKIHDNDTRFVVSNKNRILYCDICWGPYAWQGQTISHWGNSFQKNTVTH